MHGRALISPQSQAAKQQKKKVRVRITHSQLQVDQKKRKEKEKGHGPWTKRTFAFIELLHFAGKRSKGQGLD